VVVLEVPGEMPPLPAAVEAAAYRIATEAVVNAGRHAGASRVTVVLRAGTGGLEVGVDDDGAGEGPWVPGVGLTAMRERAEEVGGMLDTGPAPGGGGRVRAWLPVPVVVEAAAAAPAARLAESAR
jgi:two-component system, NarL family, sensor kinase